MLHKLHPYSAISIDMEWACLLHLVPELIKPSDRTAMIKDIEHIFLSNPEKEKLLMTLSVRTAWDLFLSVMEWPLGSEIIVTAINIPEMTKVVRYHGHIPIPIEVDKEGLKPNLKDIEAAITPQTKAIMLSYVFGAEFDLTEIIKLAKRHNLYVIEDSAECYHGPKASGHPDADMTLFSFGTIKTMTAYGGGLAVIRNNEVLYRKMKYTLENYPHAGNKFYAKKTAKNMFPMIATQSVTLNRYGRWVLNYLLNYDHREMIVSMVRGFPDESKGFLNKFRKQVPTAMIAMLLLRLRRFSADGFEKKVQDLRDVQDMLVRNNVVIPAHEKKNRYYWAYPFIADDKSLAYEKLQNRGVDAYLRSTQIKPVDSPVGSRYKEPEKTKEFFERILYLPIHLGVPRESMFKIAEEVVEVVQEINMKQAQQCNKQSKL